jgi:hypothetical protein
MDCFVASLLAMTGIEVSETVRGCMHRSVIYLVSQQWATAVNAGCNEHDFAFPNRRQMRKVHGLTRAKWPFDCVHRKLRDW